MNFSFDREFSEMPSELLSLLPLNDWSVEYEMPVEDLLFEFDLEFDVVGEHVEDEFGSYHSCETVEHEDLKVNGVCVPSELWESVLPSNVDEEILSLGPCEFGFDD